MRWAAFGLALILLPGVVGCGDSGSSPPVADASGGGGPPPPPGGGPPPPPGGETPPPADGAMPADGGTPEGNPGQPGDAPQLSPDGGTPPGDSSQNYAPPGEPALAGTPDGGFPGVPGDPGTSGNPDDPNAPRPQRPKTVREKADDAFRAGKQDEGFRLIYADFLVNPAAWPELKRHVAWIPALRRPGLGARFGVAALYANAEALPRDFEGSPQPIGSAELAQAMASFQQAASNRTSGERRRRDGQGEVTSPPAEVSGSPEQGERAGAAGQLAYYTGDFGTKLVEKLQEKIKAGEYGTLYKEIAARAARPAEGDPNLPNPGGEGGLAPPGGALDGGPPGGPGESPSEGAAGPQGLGVAVVWLGKANSRDEVLQLAQKAGVDVLITFELTLRPAKTNSFVNNKTRVKITTLKREDLFTSAELENRLVMQAREKGQDPVDKEVSRAIEALDKACKAAPLPPGITADAVKRRVAAILAEKPADPVRAAVEVRYYAVSGLLADEEASTAITSLIGEDQYQLLATQMGPPPSAAMGAFGLGGLVDVLHGVRMAGAIAGGRPPGGPAAGGAKRGKARPAAPPDQTMP